MRVERQEAEMAMTSKEAEMAMTTIFPFQIWPCYLRALKALPNLSEANRSSHAIALLHKKETSQTKKNRPLIYCHFFIYLSIMSSRLPQAPPPPLLPIAPADNSSSEVCLTTRAYD
jgi:hypothetical protein